MAAFFCTVAANGQNKHVVEEPPLSPAEQQTRFELPPGFEIQLVASEPEIAKPINMNFDAAGRLLVTQSVEYPYPASDTGRDAVVRLTIDPASGKASRVETIIDALNIPIGVTPVGRDVIVYTIPEILRCSDPDSDGRFDRRETLLRGFGYEDTHGMNNGFTRWLDGWIYACHGFRNKSETAGKDGHKVSLQSGNTYRFRDDGSRVEQFTWGQVNPFGMCFDPLGNLYTADCHSRPAYLLLRGAYYPSFGKPHDGLGYGPELMTHSHGSTGIAGVVYYDADHFPAEYRGRLFVGNPITQRINSDRLEQHGSSYVAHETPDFLVCDDPWCRPVDLKLGPDGALYFADFYNRIIGHYEVPLDHPGRDRQRGRIWRIVYRGEAGAPPQNGPSLPDLTAADLPTLVQRLSDANITTRTLATHEIVDRFGAEAIETLKASLDRAETSAQGRVHTLWALQRLAALETAALARAAEDQQPAVRVHALKALAERGPMWTGEEIMLPRRALLDPDPCVRRAAAEMLGLQPDEENLPLLLLAWKQTPDDDALMRHTVRMALRNQLNDDEVLGKVASGAFTAEEMQRLREVMLASKSPAAAEVVLQTFKANDAADPALLAHFVIRYLPQERLEHAWTRLQAEFATLPPVKQANVLTAAQRAVAERGLAFPEAQRPWCIEIGGRLLKEEQTRGRALDLVRELALRELYAPVEQLAQPGEKADERTRSQAIDTCAAIDAERATSLLTNLLGSVQEEIALRQRCALALGRIGTAAAHAALLENLKIAPEPIALAIAAALATNPTGAEKLLAAVEAGHASARLLADRNINNVLKNTKLPEIGARLQALTAHLPPQDDRLAKLIAARREAFTRQAGDAARGQQVFAKNCAACHRLGNTGQKIGPELDGIGNRGLLRVLEDVLDPSRNVDGAFRTTILSTSDGRAISGLFLRQEGATLVLADNQGKEIRVAESDVEERTVSPLSPMPGNVADLLKEPEFLDLVAFLIAQRQSQAGE